MRLAHDCGRGSRPRRVAELEPERDVERKAHRSPQPQPEEQRRTRRLEHGCVINPACDRAGLRGRWLSAGHQREAPRTLSVEIRFSFSLL